MTKRWTINPDGDAEHPDWEHTPDGEYRPKAITYNSNFDMELNGKTVTQKQLNEVRKGVRFEDIW